MIHTGCDEPNNPQVRTDMSGKDLATGVPVILDGNAAREEDESLQTGFAEAKERLEQKKVIADKLGKVYTGIKFLQSVGEALQDVSLAYIFSPISFTNFLDRQLHPVISTVVSCMGVVIDVCTFLPA